ncbi:Solute carrier family 2, facilitated glucose transporter member 1 [Holothuria leucospilota]|uniref:Solute carrier family 2, facilitated glucose transporter member 1 n=1 Tax=Holothuria leucospilota TaxID=206669 RepID=A0A9Q1BQH6_HOLLE|nr:Solute carrier family 2, facilitated glucose transporter member 1 [Holothuria leucospilota]
MEEIKENEEMSFLPHRKDALQPQNPPFGKNAKKLAILTKKHLIADPSLAYKKDIDKKKGFPVWLILTTISSTFGASTQFGYNTGVITVPAEYMRTFYNESHNDRNGNYMEESAHRWLWSTTVSVYCVGALFGALTAGYFSNKLGRKGALLFSNIFSIVASVLMFASKFFNVYELILVGRVICGFHSGLVNALVPLYMAEIAPTSLRGFIGLLHPLLMCVGIMGAQVIGFYVFRAEHEWPYLLSLPPFLACVFQLVTLPFCPESPRWLYMNKEDLTGAQKALSKLRNMNNIDKEMQQMEEEYEKESCGEKISIWKFLFMVVFEKPHWRLPFLINCVLCLGLQMSGINVVWFYITDIFKQASLSDSQIAVGTVVLGFLNIVGTLISSVLIDRVGRRPLTIIPTFILTVCCVGITLCTRYQTQVLWLQWACVGFIAVLVLALSGGPGPMVYVIGSEIWSQDPRPAAMSISYIFNWTANFSIGMFFPFLANVLGEFVFIIFGATMFVVGLFYLFCLPETKNKTFEEIAAIFRKDQKSFYEREGQNHIYKHGLRYSGCKLSEV